ncbi:MAG: CzcE family metal-binding protein [Oxalobacteraceae bacterium]|nr:CzcE family metal-binding protein [Oxalobacteraceae bacterium]
MKSKFISPAVFALILSGFSLPVLATSVPMALLGSPAPATVSARTIVIDADTKYVNVVGGDTVKFNAGDKSFAWSFDVPLTITSLDLNRVAPAGVLDHPVKVYVQQNPRYKHGS